MTSLFTGSTHVADQQLLTIISNIKPYKSYIGTGGSAVICAIVACKLKQEDIKLLLTGLRTVANEYGWDTRNVRDILNNEGLPRGNIHQLRIVLKQAFGDIKLKDVPLGVVVYNMTKRKVELMRDIDLRVVDALVMAVSMPGFYYPTHYKGDQYIDVTPINRFPVDVVPTDEVLYSIYIRSCSNGFLEEILTGASKPWQDITPDYFIDPN